MNLPQLLIDALVAEIKRVLPDHTVEAREPAESELAANETVRQVFVTSEGIEVPDGEQIASGGDSAVVLIPIMVSLVMPRPGTVVHAAQTLRRRLKVLQAIQRTVKQFNLDHSGIEGIRIVQEAPSLVEGYYVSIIGIELTFDLDAQEAL